MEEVRENIRKAEVGPSVRMLRVASRFVTHRVVDAGTARCGCRDERCGVWGCSATMAVMLLTRGDGACWAVPGVPIDLGNVCVRR